MNNNKQFKNIKVTIGTRWTTSFNTTLNEQQPNSSGKVIPTVNSTLYDVIENYINTDRYRKLVEEKAQKYNDENKLTPDNKDYRKPKYYAKSIWGFSDYRYAKYDKSVIDGKVIRTLTNKSYLEHNGFMGFDIDFPKDMENLEETIRWIKTELYNELKKYKWFCMITLSTGGKGIHIYTYNEVPDYYNKTDMNGERIAYFKSCYQFKAYFIYKALYTIYEKANKKQTYEYIFSLLDNAMYKPEQPLNITLYDNEPLINDNFKVDVLYSVVENIKNGYDNWIHREGNSLKPDAEPGWAAFNEFYCNIPKFFSEQHQYSITKGSIYIKTKQEKYKLPKNAPFYFGHSERHDGVPTLHELCQYLLATRDYNEAREIIESNIYCAPNAAQYQCTSDLLRLLDWYESRNVQYNPNQYVCDWLNAHAGFKDKLCYNEIDKILVDFYDGFIKDDKGRIDNTNIDNYILYLNNHPKYKNHLKYNIFTTSKEFTNKKFYKGEAIDYSIVDIDRVNIRNDFNRHLRFLSKNLIDDALNEVCQQNQYNPVIDYLDGLEWDGVSRIETMSKDWLGAEDTPLYRRYNKLWMIAAVKRIYEPGCKWDNVLIYQGIQGDGKTEFFKRLGKKWNTSNKLNLTNKDYINKLNKSWIVIFDELAGMNKKEMDEIKSFFSNQDDDDRLAYQIDSKKYHRHCIFAGTTNSKTFLRDTDDMYERRFWVININAKSQTYVFDNFNDDDVDKLWAEAVYLYKQNPNQSLYLGEEYKEMAKADQIQYKSFNADSTIDIINEIFDTNFSSNELSYEDFVYEFEHGANETDLLQCKKLDYIPVRYIIDYLHKRGLKASPKYICLATGLTYKNVRLGNKVFKAYCR